MRKADLHEGSESILEDHFKSNIKRCRTILNLSHPENEGSPYL